MAKVCGEVTDYANADRVSGSSPDADLRGAWLQRSAGGELLQTPLQSLPRPLPGNESEMPRALPVTISALHLSISVYGRPALKLVNCGTAWQRASVTTRWRRETSAACRLAAHQGKRPQHPPANKSRRLPRSACRAKGGSQTRLGRTQRGGSCWPAQTQEAALIHAGLDVVRVSRQLGHSNPTITLSTYAHEFEEGDSGAADAIGKVLG